MKRFLIVMAVVCGVAAGQATQQEQQRARAIQEKLRRGEQPSADEREFMQEMQRRQREQYAKANPPREATGLVPLTDLGTGTYKGEEGGLYPGGRNIPPMEHLQAGLRAARGLRPLDADGRPAESGKIVLLSVGMSNATQEFSVFQRFAAQQQGLNPRLVMVDGAQGGQTAMITANAESRYWTVSEERLRAAGVTPKQVQVAWIKQANAGPQKGWPEETRRLKDDLVKTIQVLRAKCPNVKMVYLSSRIYAGYAASPLNPEPYAYESGFAVKWVIADQLSGKAGMRYEDAPWVGWGPYLWTDGVKGRKVDGVVWTREDVAEDGTHPSQQGRGKAARMLFAFFRNDPTAREWFRGTGGGEAGPRMTRVPEGVRSWKDVAYVTNPHERQKLDLYVPGEGRNWPLVVAVHGGAWRGGSKEGEPVAAFLAKGFAVASINYRLSQHAQFPAQIEDCKAAVRWLRAHAREYGYDPRKIGVYGTSAGGHLVALLGTAGKAFDVGENLDQPSAVQAVADFFGPTDFLQMDAHRVNDQAMQHTLANSPESLLVGGLITENREKVARANPVTYVTKNAPPFLIVHGDRDMLVPHHQSELLLEALRKAGVKAELVTVQGGGHGGETTAQGLPRAVEFFETVLRGR